MDHAIIDPDKLRGMPEDVIYDIVRTAAMTVYEFERLFGGTHARVIQLAKFHALLRVESMAEEAAEDG